MIIFTWVRVYRKHSLQRATCILFCNGQYCGELEIYIKDFCDITDH